MKVEITPVEKVEHVEQVILALVRTGVALTRVRMGYEVLVAWGKKPNERRYRTESPNPAEPGRAVFHIDGSTVPLILDPMRPHDVVLEFKV